MFVYHIKHNKLFTFLNTLGLSIGIAGLVFAILYWNDEHSYNAWNPEKERVYRVLVNISDYQIWSSMPTPIGESLKNDVESYNFSQGNYQDATFLYENKKEFTEKLYFADTNFFDFFPFPFIYGNPKTALSNEKKIAVSTDFANRIFGSTKALGKTLKLKDDLFVVSGVYTIPGNSSIAPDLILNNLKSEIIEHKDDWGNYNFCLHLKLKVNTKPSDIEHKIRKLFYKNTILKWAKEEGLTPEEYIKQYGEGKYILEQLATARLNSISSYPEGNGNYQFLLIILGLSILILVLSIVNYINLATANAIKRAKEVGVKKVLGASRLNIILQFVFETVLVSIMAISLALSIVELSLPYYNDFLDKNLNIYNGLFYKKIVLVFVVIIIVAGIFPALYVSNFQMLKVLKGNFSRSKRGIWFRNVLLVLQFTIATFFYH